jgi:hypothetical protein
MRRSGFGRIAGKITWNVRWLALVDTRLIIYRDEKRHGVDVISPVASPSSSSSSSIGGASSSLAFRRSTQFPKRVLALDEASVERFKTDAIKITVPGLKDTLIRFESGVRTHP